MITGVSKDFVPYILEDDRASDSPTIFWIKPKTGHDSNKTMQRYIGATKENTRKGTRDVNVSKLDNADIEEFLAVCSKVENYGFPKNHPKYENGTGQTLEDPTGLMEVVKTLSADHLQEIFEVAANFNKLKEGEKKS